ncbi:MAG: hypothetical protein KDD26_02145 [Winogradskyella sp.]|nr:hypothetical protein [Winogradskyella sp.]
MSTYLFRYREEIPLHWQSALPNYYSLTTNTKKDILFIRLLTGTISLGHIKYKDNDGNIIYYNNKTNYSLFPKVNFNTASTKQLRDFIDPFDLSKFQSYSTKFYGSNIAFYNNLLSELSFFIFYKNINLDQSAFVYLYRMLEYVSYSFPLIHAMHQRNYIGSFNSLKSFFIGEKTSEIKFFELFINNLLSAEPILQATSDFSFDHADTTIARNCHNAFKNLLKHTEWHPTSDPSTYTLTVENNLLIRLFKATRNRYFHFAVGGQRNIGSADLKDPDFFFQCINDTFLNWIGRIFKEITKESIDNTII